MTSYEQELRERYDKDWQKFHDKIKKIRDMSERLTVKSFKASLLIGSMGETKASLHDIWAFSKEFDSLVMGDYGDGINTDIDGLLRIHGKIETEMNGYEPDPTFGVKNNDFVETQ